MFQTFSWTHVGFLAHAAEWTALLALIALSGGALGGLLIAVLRLSPLPAAQYLARGFIMLVQGTPLLVQLFLAYFGAAFAGLDVPPLVAAAVAFTLYAAAFLGDIWRGAVEAIPRGQWEAAAALGLHRISRLRLVILPQALRMTLPPAVGFLVQLVKATAVTSIIGFSELMKAANAINNATFEPFTVYGIVAAIYFALCFPLTTYARRLEAKPGR